MSSSGRIPWHRRGAPAALVLALFNLFVSACWLLVALGEELDPVRRAAESASRKWCLWSVAAWLVLAFLGEVALAIRAWDHQRIVAVATLAFAGVWLAFAVFVVTL